MAINLLPSEEKSKFKQPRKPVASLIELTFPEKAEKKQPSVKKAGVLTFFKQAFRRPQKELEKKEILPKEKIILEERLKYEKPKAEKVRPRVEFYKPAPEPSRRRGESFGQKISRFFSGIPAKKAPPAPTVAPRIPPVAVSGVGQAGFPRYRAVRAEKVALPAQPPSRPSAVVQIVTKKYQPTLGEAAATKKAAVIIPRTREGFPEFGPLPKPTTPAAVPKQAEARKKESFWQLFKRWLSRIFGSRRKPIPAGAPLPPLHAPPKPLIKEEGPFIFQKEVHVPAPEQAEPPQMRPVPPLPQKEEPREVIPAFKAPSFVPPSPPPQPVVPPTIELKKVVPPPPPPPPPPPKKKEVPLEKSAEEKRVLPTLPQEKKPAGGFRRWLLNLWRLIKSLFKSQKEVVPPPPPTPAVVPPLKGPEETVVAAAGAPAVATEMLGAAGESSQAPLPSASLSRKEKRDFLTMTRPDEATVQQAGLDWEINLVPEEVLERRIPSANWLYLILFTIIGIGLVFGGWLGVNWYYNTITTKISEVNQQITTTELYVNSYSKVLERVRALRDTITNVQTLLGKHVYWSRFFAKLEEYTIADVYYTTMTADINGTVSLTAVGKDYESAIRQLAVFQRATDFVTAATVTDVVMASSAPTVAGTTAPTVPASTTVSFSLTLTVQPTIFYYPR